MANEFEQDPSESFPYRADFFGECAKFRESNKDYAINIAVVPYSGTGFQYRVTTAGRTGVKEPRWPEVAGQTVKDGSIVLACELPTADSLERTLSSAVWTADTGLTLSGKVDASTDSTINISGGTDGQDYQVVCVGTLTGSKIAVASFTIQIRRPARVAQ